MSSLNSSIVVLCISWANSSVFDSFDLYLRLLHLTRIVAGGVQFNDNPVAHTTVRRVIRPFCMGSTASSAFHDVPPQESGGCKWGFQ